MPRTTRVHLKNTIKFNTIMKSMEDLNDIPEDLFQKPNIYEASPNNQASNLEKKNAAECLLKAVIDINNFDHTKRLLSLTKLSRHDKAASITELTRALRNEEGNLDQRIDTAMKKFAINGENNGGMINGGNNNGNNNGKNDNSDERDEGRRTTKRTGKGKRSYPKTMFKRKF
ncbi:hypothetical protein H8356DRAFT_1404229 [Neocallimastix lanati (nom. inval.)]|nr:hypothetical protein H8356DRAFT_1404229 [Neocallimastix sp. JGI-2020a]